MTIAAGALAFFGYCVAVMPKNSPEIRWYQYPVVLPVEAGIAVGGSAHSISGLVVTVVLAAECLVVGLLLDAVVALARRQSVRPNSLHAPKG